MPLYFPNSRSLLQKAKDSINRGLSKPKLASAIAVGVIGGIFPVLGTTTVLCLGLTFIFRTNHAIVQLSNWLVYPLQIAFYIPFIKLGTLIFSGPDFNLNFGHIKDAFQSGFIKGLELIGVFHLYGILAWILIGIPLGLIIFGLMNLLYVQVKNLIIRIRS